MSNKKFLWLDLETTGLDENQGVILEVSAIVTNEKFEELEIFSKVCGHPESVKSLMNEWCTKTHTKSGLLAEVLACQDSPFLVIQDLAGLMNRHWPTNMESRGEKPILCGNSIHFDRRWIRHHSPELDGRMHYRMIDVSGIYEASRGFAGFELEKHEGKHRGLSDVRDSIELAKKWAIVMRAGVEAIRTHTSHEYQTSQQ